MTGHLGSWAAQGSTVRPLFESILWMRRQFEWRRRVNVERKARR